MGQPLKPSEQILEDIAAPRRGSTARAVTLPNAIDETIDRIANLKRLGRDWNGGGELEPNGQAIESANGFVSDAEACLRGAGLPWQAPHVAASEVGEVVLEWWSGSRNLTVYVGADSTEYIKSWGPSMTKEMEDGAIESSSDFLAVFKWLVGE